PTHLSQKPEAVTFTLARMATSTKRTPTVAGRHATTEAGRGRPTFRRQVLMRPGETDRIALENQEHVRRNRRLARPRRRNAPRSQRLVPQRNRRPARPQEPSDPLNRRRVLRRRHVLPN